MKTILQRAAALILSAAMLCPVALASDALGSHIYSYTLDICDDTTLTRQVMWSASRSDLRTENYVTYTPSPSVSPKVSFGTSVLAKQSVLTMAKSLEKGGDRVLSGINGDYFVMATGDPLGLVVTDGLLRSSASYLSAIGFNNDGTAVIGKPDLTLRADIKGDALQIAAINKIRDGNTFHLFTDDFGATTKNTKAGVDIILTPLSGAEGQAVTGESGNPLTTANHLRIGGLTSCRVEQVIEAEGATAIPDGKYVLSVIGTGNEYFLQQARSLQPGDTIDIEVYSPDPRWNTVDAAVGAMYHIIMNGQLHQTDTASLAPRTAVGVKANGDVIFYTIDGRKAGHSVGATIKMVAQRLLELGCTEAVLLDGGGSTTMVSTYPDGNAAVGVNTPSEGSPRAVTNAIFLVSNLDPTGRPGSLYVTPSSLTLLPGATTQCVATAMDTGWYPMAQLPGDVTWSAHQGTVTADGLYTAPAQTGAYTVTASSGGVTGSTVVQVYDTPTAITLTNHATGKRVSSLNLLPGQRVDLDAAASYLSVGLTGGDTCFTWSLDPNLGTVTASGLVTAGANAASGKLTIRAGGHTASIPVTVGSSFPLVEVTLTGTALTATATDTLHNGLPEDRISLTVDGTPHPFTYDIGTGQLTADLSDLTGSLHQVTVTAANADGNRARDSAVLTTGSPASPFPDMGGHWAESYTTRLNELSIITGMPSGDRLLFQPNLSITRGDFALMTARWLGLDLDSYANITLPYADQAAIPTWDLNAVQALYDLGVMTGSAGNDGKLYANAAASITRAEAMTILGRVLPEGFDQADLSQFSDSAAIPAWAKPHLATLVELDVVGGSDGKVRPTDTVTRAEVAKMLFTLW